MFEKVIPEEKYEEKCFLCEKIFEPDNYWGGVFTNPFPDGPEEMFLCLDCLELDKRDKYLGEKVWELRNK